MKRINPDPETPRYTPFSLMEYTSAMTDDTGIRIIETMDSHTASVDPDTKTITIPAVDYSKPMTRDRYRITKGYIDHEIAHMLYPDLSYLNTTKDPVIFNIANLVDDIRIEAWHAKNYVGIGEDFHYLNQLFYEQERFFNRDNLHEKSLPSLMGTIAVYYFGINHSESFNQDVFDFLRLEVFPVIDKHNDSKSPNALRTAEKIAELIQDFLSQDQTSVSNKQEISEDNDSDIPSKQDADSSSGNDSDDSTGDNQAPVQNTDKNEKDGDELPSIENSAENTKATGCDIASHMAKRIENDMSFTPSNYPIIADYHDTITDLSDSRCMNSDVNTNIYQHVCKEYAPAISAYRNMFGSFLISTARCRTLKTQSGKFNHRDITHIVTSPVPRIFTRKLEGRKFGYDVTLLMDCSGSMGEFSFKESRDSKIMKAYEALVILAEALRGLSGINLEILAFTADIRYTPGMHLSISDSCNNQLFILKPFANHAAGALPFFPSLHKEYHLSEDNFDIGAIKISSRRLRQMPSLNRKLLIVLSDGQPSSDISSGTEILKSYVEELSHIHPILGIGLENPHIGQCYPNSVNINDLSELSGQVLINIRNFLIKQMTG